MTGIMVVMIVAIVVAGRVAQARFRAQNGGGGCGAPAAYSPPPADIARMEAELRQLKARVATLERIVTDRSSTLDQEIEALRDRA